MDGYEPVVDNYYVDLIAKSRIASKKAGIILNSKAATEFTFSRVADAHAKYAKIIDEAYDRLGISRRARLTGQEKTETAAVVTNSLLEALRIAESDQ